MKLVIFDFDGVLVNTLEFAFSINKKKNPDLSWNLFQEFSDGNFCDGIKKAVNVKKHVVPVDYNEQYQKEIEKINILDILHKSILALKEKYCLAIVSSTRTQFIENFLQKEKIRECFSDILGVDVHESKVVKINSLLKKYNILPRDVVFITDSLGDILEGNKCGVLSVGVTWGIHDKNKLEKGKPIAIVDDPRDLLNIINNFLNKTYFTSVI
jgi:phosphoglycolate phosphatase-like HAD superfamily hydrolase